MFPKILIISNTAFNLSDSNGRVLGTLLTSVPNQYKLQFCLNGNAVSPELIEDSYRITDIMVLRSLWKNSICAEKLSIDTEETIESAKAGKYIQRTAATMLAREMVWHIGMKRTEFISLVKEFDPDIVLWQLGDSAFLADLTMQVAEQCQSKIVVFTTEDYYFKTWDYLKKGDGSLLYSVFSHKMRKSVRKLFSEASLCIANTPFLANRYRTEFGVETEVIMQPYGANVCEEKNADLAYRQKRIVYAGNLGINRHKSLISIAQTLYEIDSSIRFEIYGRAREGVIKELEKEPNIELKGFVNYRAVLDIVRNSMLVVHAESFEDFYRYDLEAAFSTKITDAMVSGTPLFVYAPDNLAETRYLIENNCAFVCGNQNDLKQCLYSALTDSQRRCSITANAKSVALQNHDAEKNRLRMLELLNSVLER